MRINGKQSRSKRFSGDTQSSLVQLDIENTWMSIVHLHGDLWLQLLGDGVEGRQGAGNAGRTLPERSDNLFGILEGSEGRDKIHPFAWKTERLNVSTCTGAGRNSLPQRGGG